VTIGPTVGQQSISL